MGEKTLMKPVIITAGLIGLIQGLVWAFLSLISIFYYHKIMEIDSHQKTLGSTIYSLYLDPNDTLKNLNVTGKQPIIDFNIFIYLYFAFSLVLLASSTAILWGNLRNKLEAYKIQLLSVWIGTVCLLSILDVVLMSLIASDYQLVSQYYDSIDNSTAEIQATKTIILASMGIVMTLAARGYIIWLINVIFAVILAKCCRDILTKDRREETTIIDAFGNSTRPPWDLQNSLYDDNNAANFEFTNKGFKDDNNEPIYSRSESFHHLQVNPKDQRLDKINTNIKSPSAREEQGKSINNNDYNTINNFANTPMNRFSYEPDNNQNQSPLPWKAPHIKTAKIGRQAGQRSPPLSVAPPFIPAPDYSPSNSLRVKGVLKPKSQYLYH